MSNKPKEIKGLHLFLNSHSMNNEKSEINNLNSTGILHFSLYQEDEFGNFEIISHLDDVLIKNTTKNRVALYSGILGLQAVEKFVEKNKNLDNHFPNTLLHIHSLQNNYLFEVLTSRGEKWKNNGYFEVQEENIGSVIENVTLVQNLLNKKDFLKQNNLILKTDYLGQRKNNDGFSSYFERRANYFHHLHDNFECDFYSSTMTVLEHIPNYDDYYIQHIVSKQHYDNGFSNVISISDRLLGNDRVENNIINEMENKITYYNKTKTEEKIDFSELKELTQKRDELSNIIEQKILEKQQIEEKIQLLQERSCKKL